MRPMTNTLAPLPLVTTPAGVGAGWTSTPLPTFTELLEGMTARKDKLRGTGHIHAGQYAAERNAARAERVAVTDEEIRLTLTCPLDPKVYDQPLPLTTRLPEGWNRCAVLQGTRTAEAVVHQAVVRYDALPGPGPIVIRKK